LVDTANWDFVHIVEDLIDFSLTEIEHPLNLIPETPVGNCSRPDDFSDVEGFKSECTVLDSNDMEYNNDHNEERGNPPQNNQPWVARDALTIPG
jgi:hypothetical protein